MTNIPPFSPGCFGSALAFKETDSVCRGCVFRSECEPVHLASVAAMRAHFGIKDQGQTAQAKKASKAAVAAPAVDPETLMLSKKTEELLRRLDQGDYQVINKLREGLNPFGNTMPWMKIACHLLLVWKKPINQHLLAVAFAEKLDWKDATAHAHARMTIAALTHIGAVDNLDGAITLRRS